MGNDQAQFEALVQAHSADLYRFAYWLCRERARAEDLVQETFLRAWRSLGSLRQEAAAKAWLVTILRREHARGYARYRPETDAVDPDMLAAAAENPVENLQLRRALDELPEDYRFPLLLQVLGGFSGEEIANIMDLSAGTVMTRLFRARQRLRGLLDDSLDSRNVSLL